MPLRLTMLKAPASVAMTATTIVLDEKGGTLGRGPDNTWVLDDPDLYLSSLHCQFSFENGQYYLVDHSTNGTFYGGSMDPMGKGTRLPVYNNDRFAIGDYEFSIGLETVSAGADDPFADAGAALGSGGAGDSLDGFASNPFAVGSPSTRAPLFTAEPGDADPLAALDKARGQEPFSTSPSGAADPFAGPTHSDGADSLNQQIDWPEPKPAASGGVIPDDWNSEEDETRRPAPAPATPAAGEPSPELVSRQQELEQANARIQQELDQLKQNLRRQRGVETDNQVDTSFVEALGLLRHNLSDAEILEINRLGGEVLREMIGGLMQVLGSRSSIKNEFRMNVTTIQPVENNPLKFSANIDDALENMFIKQGNAFKKPIESVREGFEGVAEHQVAILAGIREAFKVVIERFDPDILEESYSKQNRGGLLPGSQKAKNWEFYVDYYRDLAGDIDKSFQYLFGDGFVRAYEDQLQKLAVTRKSRKFNEEN